MEPIFGVEIKDRKFRFKTYTRCFLGNEFAKWLIEKEFATEVEGAVKIGQEMVGQGLL